MEVYTRIGLNLAMAFWNISGRSICVHDEDEDGRNYTCPAVWRPLRRRIQEAELYLIDGILLS
jgi:hypothetical protein